LAAASMQAVQHARHPAPILELPRQERREAVAVLVFSKPGVQRYATEAQMRGEKELRAAAVRRDAPVLAVDKVHALIEGRAAARTPFGTDQEAAVHGIPLRGGGRSHRRTRQDRSIVPGRYACQGATGAPSSKSTV
jgi:hypothetical protein